MQKIVVIYLIDGTTITDTFLCEESSRQMIVKDGHIMCNIDLRKNGTLNGKPIRQAQYAYPQAIYTWIED